MSLSSATFPMSEVKITGFGVAYPPTLVPAGDMDQTAYALFNPSPALDKVLAMNRRSGIKTRAMVSPWDSPFHKQPTAPPIGAISELFLNEGVKLAVSAARAAMTEARVSAEGITHLVASTCTNSSNPGYDLLVARALGLGPTVERVLLHGVGCTGGLAGLRLAASLCHAAAYRGDAANVLVVACEVLSSFARNELDSIARDQEIRAAPILFGDGASALMLSITKAPNDDSESNRGIYEIVHCTHLAVPGTEHALTANLTPQGWKETANPQLPSLISSNIPVLYETLLSSLPASVRSILPTNPADLDWPVHASSAHFLNEAVKLMGIDKENLQASWEVYEHHGNTSSSSVFCVLDMSRQIQDREWAVSLAFGPGLLAEAVLLRRIRRRSQN